MPRLYKNYRLNRGNNRFLTYWVLLTFKLMETKIMSRTTAIIVIEIGIKPALTTTTKIMILVIVFTTIITARKIIMILQITMIMITRQSKLGRREHIKLPGENATPNRVDD